MSKITKENKKIHERINSQKSFYSNADLNKSYEENAEISKRLTNSKMSRCTSNNSRVTSKSNNSVNSRCSLRSNKSGNGNKLKVQINKPCKTKITVESKKLDELKTDQI